MSLVISEPGRNVAAGKLVALIATPAVVVFLSSNLVNVGNLAFNMIFSRLMGPELFGVLAMLLAIKLALLGILGAVQSAVSKTVAGASRQDLPSVEMALARLNRVLLLGLPVVGLPLAMIVLAVAGNAGLGLPSPNLLWILLAAVPFGASLSLLRGVAFGHLNAGRIAFSANVEMAVRLVGALVLWQLGFGIEGVVAAVSLSIAAGWVVLIGTLPRPFRNSAIPVKGMASALMLGAMPFGLLQLAQVLALDGEIFLAKSFLPANEVGVIAALSLFQKIQFFACFALASILLPALVTATRNGSGTAAAIMPVAVLFIAVSLTLLTMAALIPDMILRVLAGSEYLAASGSLFKAAVAASAFTLSYLVANFLAAHNDRTGIAIVLFAAILQLTLVAASSPESLSDILAVKVACQTACAALMTIHAVLKFSRPANRAA